MRRILSLVLILMVVLGSAYAEVLQEAKQSVYDELGFCDVNAYEGKTWGDSFGIGEARAYEVEEYVDLDSGLLTWDIEWETNEGERGYVVFEEWFPARGIIAELMYDLDSDGEDEWIVAYNQDVIEIEYNDEYEYHCLMLRIYEQTENGLEMTDEIRLQGDIDKYGHYSCLFLMERDDEPLLVFQGMSGVDGLANNIREVFYRDGELHAGAGCMWESTDTARLFTCSEASEDDSIYRWYDELEAAWEYDYREENREEGYALFEQAIKSMGLSWEGDQAAWDAVVCAEDSTILLKFDTRDEVDAQGKPVVRIQRNVPGSAVVSTASVNLRTEPGLDGEIIAAAEAGTTMAYLGEESTDDRGVVWYKVMYEAQACWVSSKYAEIN